MITATQSAHERELSARLRKAADQRLSAALDSKKRSSTACHFEEALRGKIVGQEEAVQALVDLYQVFCAGLRRTRRHLCRQHHGLFRSDDAGRSGKALDLPWPEPGLEDGVEALACLPE
jgi:hypothetical protein